MNREFSDDLLPGQVVAELLQASSDATVVTNAEGIIIFANREAEILFGYDKGEMLGEAVEILMPRAHRKLHQHQRSSYETAPRSRPMVSGLELLARHKRGDHFRVEIALTPVRTPDGLLVASAIRRIEQDDQTDAYFRVFLESAPDAMVIADREGKISIVNSQVEQMFGYERERLLGEPVEMLLPHRLRREHAKNRQGYMSEPTVRPMGAGRNLIGLRADGSQFPVEISLSPVRTASGSFVCSVIRDVTERKQMEDDIIAARREAERANKANSAFLAAASHDLRQPVQALSLLNGALRRTVDDPRAQEMIQHQENSLAAMTNLLNSLLDISRLDAGAVVPEIEEFPIQRLIDRLAAEFGRQAQQKGLTFTAHSCSSVVRSDPNLLSEIIQNFVSNAIRYTESGTVDLYCRHQEGRCIIEVRDTGVGISEEQLVDIFQEFHQIQNSSGNKEGFGLGLAIVKRLSDLLGHRIEVESRPGQGSCFGVTLPAVAATRVAVTDTEVPDIPENSAAQGLVILIEDDQSVADAWGLLLAAEGYEVETAASASEAMEIARAVAGPPRLIISDFHLIDDSTGVEAVTELREYFERDIPAFIVSGDTSKVVKDARPVRNSTLLSKPVNTGHLLEAASYAAQTGKVPEK